MQFAVEFPDDSAIRHQPGRKRVLGRRWTRLPRGLASGRNMPAQALTDNDISSFRHLSNIVRKPRCRKNLAAHSFQSSSVMEDLPPRRGGS